MKNLKVAIMDDDLVFALTLKELITDLEAEHFTDSQSGIEAILAGNYDILLLDYFIDERTGAEVVQKIREYNQEIYILVLTGFSEEIPAMEALKKLDIQDYCEKSAGNLDEILIRLASAVNSVMQIKILKETLKGQNFAHRLKILREHHQELQTDLADLLGVSRQAIGSYESGRSEPNFELLKIISKHYKVSIDYLLGNI